MPVPKIAILPAEMATSIQDTINDIMKTVADYIPERPSRILFSSRQNSLKEAILADLLDAVPIAGEVSNAFRVRDATIQQKPYPRRVIANAIDFAAGLAPPPVGTILNILTPTNIIIYLQEKENIPTLSLLRGIQKYTSKKGGAR